MASKVWTKKAGQSKSGGLNAKGRAAYNRANNANLKAPTKSKTSKRRRVFSCQRMLGHEEEINF